MPEPHESLDEIYAKLTSTAKCRIKISLENVQDLYSEEQRRKSTTESKATTLLGFSGLVTTFIVRYGDFLFSYKNDLSFLQMLTLGSTYALTVLFIMVSIGYSLKTLSIGKYRLNKNTDNIYDFQNLSEINIMKEWITTTIYSISYNMEINNKKVGFVSESQNYFSGGIIFLSLNAVFLVTILLFKTYTSLLYSTVLMLIINFLYGLIAGIIINFYLKSNNKPNPNEN